MDQRGLWRIPVYCVATATVLAGLNLYVARHPIYRAKARRVDELYMQLEGQGAAQCALSSRVLVVGNSYVARSFAPADECRYLKFTVSGMPLLDVVGIVRDLRPRDRVRQVVIGLGYNEANPVNSDSSMYLRYTSRLPWERLLWSAPLVRGRGMALTLLKEDMHCLASATRCARSQHPEGDSAAAIDVESEPSTAGSAEVARRAPSEAAATVLTQADFEKSIRARYLEYRPSTASVSPRLREELAKLAAICRDRHVPLLVYTAPIAPPLRRKLGQHFIDSFHAEVSRAGVSYVDLNELAQGWDASYFLDATHVSERGSRIVTARILRLTAR